MCDYQFSPTARRKLRKLARRSPELARMIMRKIIWLAENAEQIAHQTIKGSHFYSLHSVPYRAPYLLDKNERRIVIDDIAKHDPAYGRISKL
jgi:mRNA-degrading endonuclease RelE of RelBE toxin-antitoxin system